MKKNIKDFNLEDLKQEMQSLGETPFRAEQIFKWIFKENVNSFDKDNYNKNSINSCIFFQKNSTAAGFEPTRVTPSDFESDALTTRPNCLDNIYKIFKLK